MRPARLVAALAVVALLAVAARMVSSSTTIPETTAACAPRLRASLPLQIHGYVATLPVTVNGHETQFALDSGTSDSYILQRGRDAFALPSAPVPDSWTVGSFAGDQAQTAFVAVAHLELAGRELGPRIMPVTTLEDEPGATHVETGTIGADLLKGVDVDIDIPHARIAFYAADSACPDHAPPWAGHATRAPITPLGSGSPTIPVAFDGRTTPTLFASFWERTLLRDFPVGTAGALPLVPETPPIPLAPLAEARTIAIGALVDGPFTIRLWRKPPPIDYATRPDTSNIAILGFDVIRRHRFWVSLASRQLFVALPDGAP